MITPFRSLLRGNNNSKTSGLAIYSQASIDPDSWGSWCDNQFCRGSGQLPLAGSPQHQRAFVIARCRPGERPAASCSGALVVLSGSGQSPGFFLGRFLHPPKTHFCLLSFLSLNSYSQLLIQCFCIARMMWKSVTFCQNNKITLLWKEEIQPKRGERANVRITVAK